jgi:hypothetical protein
MPAGPGGQFSLFGGTPYMFAANATDDEVNAALDYLIVMGRSPDVTDDALEGLRADASYRADHGIPIIPRFPAWDSDELTAAEDAVRAEFLNIDMRLFQSYFDATTSPGNLRQEEPGLTQDMYSELTNVLQAILTDRNADIQALLDAAQDNLTRLLEDAGMAN